MLRILLNNIAEYKKKGIDLVHLQAFHNVESLKKMDCQINISDRNKVEILCNKTDAKIFNLPTSQKPVLLSIGCDKLAELKTLAV